MGIGHVAVLSPLFPHIFNVIDSYVAITSHLCLTSYQSAIVSVYSANVHIKIDLYYGLQDVIVDKGAQQNYQDENTIYNKLDDNLGNTKCILIQRKLTIFKVRFCIINNLRCHQLWYVRGQQGVSTQYLYVQLVSFSMSHSSVNDTENCDYCHPKSPFNFRFDFLFNFLS